MAHRQPKITTSTILLIAGLIVAVYEIAFHEPLRGEVLILVAGWTAIPTVRRADEAIGKAKALIKDSPK